MAGLAMVTLARSPEFASLILADGFYGLGLGAAQPSLMAWAVDRPAQVYVPWAHFSWAPASTTQGGRHGEQGR
jgi:hypothetical protein